MLRNCANVTCQATMRIADCIWSATTCSTPRSTEYWISADFVTDVVLGRFRQSGIADVSSKLRTAPPTTPASLSEDYWKYYNGESTYEDSFEEYFDEKYIVDLIQAIYGRKPPYSLLDCGSANGLTLERFQRERVDAWGVEYSTCIHDRTPSHWKHRNILADVRDLPFEDNSFDFVYETCLCHVPEDDIDTAISEIFRVCRIGLYFGSITTDLKRKLIEAHDLFYGVQCFGTLGWWSEFFVRNGFHFATSDPKRLARAWKIEVQAGECEGPWYPPGKA